jgi:thiamine transporter ThiT
MILASLMLALGIVLPFITGNVAFLGSRFLPMHLPVLLCGILCGKKYGLIVGLMTPLLRSVLVGMPPLFPIAVVMSLELAAYGFFIGLIYSFLPKKLLYLVVSLVSAMILGRIVWGVSAYIIYPLAGMPFTLDLFLAGAFINAVPGIIFQLIFIPAFLQSLIRTELIQLKEAK